MLFIGTVFASSWGPVGIMSVWSERITKDAAFWGMVTGFFPQRHSGRQSTISASCQMAEYAPPVIGTIASFIVILASSPPAAR